MMAESQRLLSLLNPGRFNTPTLNTSSHNRYFEAERHHTILPIIASDERLERRAKSAECQDESPYEVRLAGHLVPESCATVRKGRREVLTGVSAGEVSNGEIISWRGRCC